MTEWVGGALAPHQVGRRWVASIKHNSKNIYIGTFTAIEPAYIAYRLTKRGCAVGVSRCRTWIWHINSSGGLDLRGPVTCERACT